MLVSLALTLTSVIVGNDAHYTLAAFKHMCTLDSAVLPVVEKEPIRFVIRDAEPEDFIVKPPKETPPALRKPPTEQAALEQVDLISFDEDDDEEYLQLNNLSGVIESETTETSTMQYMQNGRPLPSHAPSARASEGPDCDGAAGETGSEVLGEEVPKPAFVEGNSQISPPVSKPIRYFHNDFLPLPTDTFVMTPNANHKKKFDGRHTPSRVPHPTIETDLSKYGNFIDDLTDIFGQIPDPTERSQDTGRVERVPQLGILCMSS